MADGPWTGDACSLVDAFREGERSPAEELDATIAAIESSQLNAFAHLSFSEARVCALDANVQLPFGGVPFLSKELEPVADWPNTEASLVFGDRVSSYDSTMVERLRAAGFVPVGSTTSSEFGGLNVSVSKNTSWLLRLGGPERNLWAHTAGPSHFPLAPCDRARLPGPIRAGRCSLFRCDRRLGPARPHEPAIGRRLGTLARLS